MSVQNLVTAPDLGSEFDVGTEEAGRITLNLGVGLTKQSNGEIERDPIFQTLVIWAEEGAALGANQDEWSFGNGAAGQIGITIVDDWEIYAVSLNLDTSSAGGPVTIALRDNAAGADLPGGVITFPVGVVNNVAVFVKGLTIPILEGMVLGFRTVTEPGTNSDARVCAWLRRPV